MTQLTVEVGQTYRDAMGRKCGPMAKIMTPKGKALFYTEGQDPACSWVDKSGQCVEPERCLIALWAEEAAGPVRTRTVTEIMDGTFAEVEVSPVEDPLRVAVRIADVNDMQQLMTSSELRAAADVLLQLADALEAQP